MNGEPNATLYKVWVGTEDAIVLFFTGLGLRWTFGWWLEGRAGGFTEAAAFAFAAMGMAALVNRVGRPARWTSYAALLVIAVLGGAQRWAEVLWGIKEARRLVPVPMISPWGTTALYLLGASMLVLAVHSIFVFELWGWNKVFAEPTGGPQEKRSV